MTNKEQKLFKELQKEAFYIGEEGEMACFAKTEMGAQRKFRARIREDCGDSWELEELSKENIGIGWFQFATEAEKEEYGQDCEYFVSYKEKTPYEVWVYRI
jgi:hypothetical protein